MYRRHVCYPDVSNYPFHNKTYTIQGNNNITTFVELKNILPAKQFSLTHIHIIQTHRHVLWNIYLLFNTISITRWICFLKQLENIRVVVLSCLVVWGLTECVLAAWVGPMIQKIPRHVLIAEGCGLWRKRGTFCTCTNGYIFKYRKSNVMTTWLM